MHILQLFGCVRGKHLRSRRKAWHDGSIWRSRCVGCGTPMIRKAGSWQLDRDPPDTLSGHSNSTP